MDDASTPHTGARAGDEIQEQGYGKTQWLKVDLNLSCFSFDVPRIILPQIIVYIILPADYSSRKETTMTDTSAPDLTDDCMLDSNADEKPSTLVLLLCMDDDLDGLTDLLFHGDSQKVREDAALAIGMLVGAEAVGPFIDLFAEDDHDLRMAASWGLSAIGTPAVDGLIAALAAEDAGIRMWAAYTLGAIGHCKAESALGTALKDEDAGVRWWASWALDQILQRHGCCNGC